MVLWTRVSGCSVVPDHILQFQNNGALTFIHLPSLASLGGFVVSETCVEKALVPSDTALSHPKIITDNAALASINMPVFVSIGNYFQVRFLIDDNCLLLIILSFIISDNPVTLFNLLMLYFLFVCFFVFRLSQTLLWQLLTYRSCLPCAAVLLMLM